MTATSSTRRKQPSEARISVVLPVYNEKDVLDSLHRQVVSALKTTGSRYEIIFVDDGSQDGSSERLDALAERDTQVRVLHLSRNFGHQAAVQAGLSHASGDAVAVMDSDLQDDPGSLPRLIDKWQEGYDIVYAVRTGRKEGLISRLCFFLFYRLLNMIARLSMPTDAGNFSVLDRRAADQIAGLADRDRYFAGLRWWVGFRQTGVEVERGERYDQRPRVSFIGLLRLAKTAILSFSTLPLTIFFVLAFVSMLTFVALGSFTLYHKLFTGKAIAGWTSILLTASFFGAINSLGIGMLGEYVLRIYDQVRARPMYIVRERVDFGSNGK